MAFYVMFLILLGAGILIYASIKNQIKRLERKIETLMEKQR